MPKKRIASPPTEAELLYSRLLNCEPRDGLVFVQVASGDFTQSGLLTLKMAMELHHKLGRSIESMLADVVVRLPSATEHH